MRTRLEVRVVRETVLEHVRDVQHRLHRQQEQLAHQHAFLVRERDRARRPALVERRAQLLQRVDARLRVLVAALGHALVAGDGLVDRFEVGQRQFGIDGLDVGDRIDLVGDVDHVRVLEAAHHVRDRIDLADVGEELVAQALAAGAPATRPAMSTNSTAVGITFCGFTIALSAFRRGSGTGTTPTLGSMVQNGKFAAAMPALVSALNRVDLPTFGRPTMPH